MATPSMTRNRTRSPYGHLTGVTVDYSAGTPDRLELEKLLVHICDVTTVRSCPFLSGLETAHHLHAGRRRHPVHRFEAEPHPAKFVPYLQSALSPPDNLDTLIGIGGNLVDTSEVLACRTTACRRRTIGRARHAGRSFAAVPSGRLPVQRVRGSAARAHRRIQAPIRRWPASSSVRRQRVGS